MKRRFLSVIFFVVMATSLVTRCVGSSSGTADTKTEEIRTGNTRDNGSTGTGNKSTQAASRERVILTVMDRYTPEDPHGQYIYQYVEESMKENPDARVGIQVIASGDIYAKLVTMATSPDDLPAIFFTSANQVPTLYDLGLTEDLNNWMDKEVISGLASGVMDACTIDRQTTYYPVVVRPQAVICRVGRSGEAGLRVPATWDESVDCAEALTKDTNRNGQMDQWGFSMVGSNNSSGQSRLISYLWNNGYELTYQEDGSDEWKTDTIADPASVGVLSKWTDMNNMEGVAPTSIAEVDHPTAANYFAMGYTSMFLTGPDALGVAYANNPGLKEKLGSFKLPGEYSDTVLGAEGYVITAKSVDAEEIAAAKCLAFFTSHDRDMKFWEPNDKIPLITERQEVPYIAGDDYADSLRQIEDGYRLTLAFAGISRLKSALGDAYVAMFSNEKISDQVVEQLVKNPDRLLEDYN